MNNLSYESEGCPVYLYEWTKWNAEEKRYMTFFRNTTITELQDLHNSDEVSPIAKERLVYLIQNHERDVYRS